MYPVPACLPCRSNSGTEGALPCGCPDPGRAGSFAYVGRAVPVRPLRIRGSLFFWLCAWLYFLSEPGDCIRKGRSGDFRSPSFGDFPGAAGKGANNINLVTAGHYVPQVIRALACAKSQGLRIPIVYNSSGYEKAETLRQLEGLIDIYLPDLKYLTPELAAAYSHAPDYPQYAMEAISEMVRQQPQAEFIPEDRTEASPIMRRGVIVRHLLLPGHVREAKKVVGYLHETYGDQIYISMMNQYTPMSEKFADPNLNRRVTKREYERLLDYAAEIGVENGFYQEGATADESFIPEFDYEGVRKK